MKKGTYTYKQILMGLRSECLDIQNKLDQLTDYIIIHDKNELEYYFNLYKSYHEDALPELVLERNVKRGFLERLGIGHITPSRVFMVRDNNGVYYPLRKSYFTRNDFNINIKQGAEKEFKERAEEILNSGFALYMPLENQVTATDNQSKPRIIGRPFRFQLLTDKSQIEYYWRNNTLQFASVKRPDEEWGQLTQEYLDYISSIEFPKDTFSEWHQSAIEKSADDDRPLVLADDYEPKSSITLEIQEQDKKIILAKSKKD